jgi:hypothetical protein
MAACEETDEETFDHVFLPNDPTRDLFEDALNEIRVRVGRDLRSRRRHLVPLFVNWLCAKCPASDVASDG